MNTVEILAHISAPSKATDDFTYREQANACLDFEPVTRTRVYGSLSDDGHANDAHKSHEAKSVEISGEARLKQSLDGFETSSDAFLTLGDDSISALRALPTNPSNLDQVSPSNSHSDENAGSSVGQKFSLDDEIPGPPKVDLQTVTFTQSQESNLSFEAPPSEVPDSQSAFASTWDVEKDNSPDRRHVQVIHISRSPLDQSPCKRQRLSQSPGHVPSSMPDEARQPSVSLSASKQVSSSVQKNPAAPTESGTFFSSLPIEINPPPPVTSSSAQLTTHITQPLNMLAETLKLSRVFKPTRQVRPLRSLERGYWSLNFSVYESAQVNEYPAALDRSSGRRRVNTGPWSIDFFLQFWNFLSVFIGKEGRAGWGVWCICDSSERPLSTIEDDHPPNARQLDVKIYTWGEVAPHIYLLIYLASERRIKKVPNVQWRDGKEEPIIFMS